MAQFSMEIMRLTGSVPRGNQHEATSIVAIQKESVTAWAKLFELPVVMAFNT